MRGVTRPRLPISPSHCTTRPAPPMTDDRLSCGRRETPRPCLSPESSARNLGLAGQCVKRSLTRTTGRYDLWATVSSASSTAACTTAPAGDGPLREIAQRHEVGPIPLAAAHAAEGPQRLLASSPSASARPPPTPKLSALRYASWSPSTATKMAGEHYCRVFAELYGLETVSLRYFNVFGPRQRPDSAYAAVLPLFIDALRNGQPQMVHERRPAEPAFVYIEDAVAAILAAATRAGCGGPRSGVQHRRHPQRQPDGPPGDPGEDPRRPTAAGTHGASPR